jgi:hypothetical protein
MLRCVRGEEEQRPIAFQRSGDEEEEHRGEEEWRGEEAENVGEGPNEEEDEGEEEAELECVPRQTQRSHVVAPPIAPTQEVDRVLIRPLSDR